MKELLLIACLVVSTGCSIVSPGDRGVRVILGKAQDEVLNPGAYLWIPFLYGIDKVDVQVQKSEIETNAATSDQQTIEEMKVAVNWSVSPERVVDVYKKLGDESEIYSRIIAPAVSEVLKASTAQMTAENILSKRLELKKMIDSGLKERLSQYGVSATDVSVIDFRFSKQYMDAVEAKQVAEQRAKQAQYEVDKAHKDAESHVALAEGQAQAQRALQSSITPGILQKMAIEKWDGKFPQYMAGGQLPFLNLMGVASTWKSAESR